MNRITVITATLVAVFSVASIPALADGHRHFKNRDPGVNARQHHQAERIKQGVRSGELTRSETRDLMQEHREIRAQERAYKSDGVMTREERKDMHQDLDNLSKNIYSEKHDEEKRPKAQ
jgi:uncharacterized protein (DUF3084 family)